MKPPVIYSQMVQEEKIRDVSGKREGETENVGA